MIVDKVLKRMKGWKETSLTKAGREILIKAVIQAIPTYTMSCFLFPRSTCEEIEKAATSFFWGSTEGNRKTHWASWEKISRAKQQGGLGFRELYFFNLALVAKQFWRIIHHPDSTLSKILRARYFPRSDIRHAQIGYQPSYLWRSIITARKLVEEGMAWRVGNGESIDCFRDAWIGPEIPKIPTQVEHSRTDINKVADLINYEDYTWREDIIKELFTHDDAELIIRTPLSMRLPQDVLIWPHTKTGEFSVKSAYHIAVKKFSKCGASIPTPSIANPLWKKMWQLQTLPKIRHFLWNACSDTLATKENLRRRGMQIDPICTSCGESIESTTHVLVACSFAQTVWRLSPLRIDLDLFSTQSFRTLCGEIFQTLPNEAISLFAYISWSLWKARNARVFGENEDPPEMVIHRAMRAHAETYPDLPTRCTENPRTHSHSSWSKPPPLQRKLNSDAAVFKDGTFGFGFVIRDDKGEVLLAGSKRCKHTGSSTLAETLALRFALKTSIEAGIGGLQIETDSEHLVKCLNGDSTGDPYVMLLVDDIRGMADFVQSSGFFFARREANKVAHTLARVGTCCNFEQIWVEEVPANCNHLILNDVTGREPILQ